VYETQYGAKYEATRNWTKAQIAQGFRDDVKAAIAAGELPKGLKLSVKTRRGGAIDVHIREVPGMTTPWAPGHDGSVTEEAARIHGKLKALLWAYNYDGSDIMTDYFHVRFYGDVEWRLDVEPVTCWRCKAVNTRGALRKGKWGWGCPACHGKKAAELTASPAPKGDDHA
jgi:hypothetical protein